MHPETRKALWPGEISSKTVATGFGLCFNPVMPPVAVIAGLADLAVPGHDNYFLNMNS